MYRLIYRGCNALIAVTVLAAASAYASETPAEPVLTTNDDKPALVTGKAAVHSVFTDIAPQDERRLEQLRGGSEPVWNDMKLSGTVGGNSAQNVVTGANIITDGAFSNAVGLPTVIQNSGANVLIQNATIVNVQIR